jgi:hypothetical protein
MPTTTTTRRAKTSPKASAARRSAGSANGATRAKATRPKASQAKTAARSAKTEAGWAVSDRSSGVVFGDYAERALLIPVGAALIARDRVVSSFNDTISSYSSTARAQAQLRRFERRGATARNRLEREVRKARVRVERELRQRRREIEKTVSELDERRDAVAKNGTDLANRVQERILSLV